MRQNRRVVWNIDMGFFLGAVTVAGKAGHTLNHVSPKIFRNATNHCGAWLFAGCWSNVCLVLISKDGYELIANPFYLGYDDCIIS